MSLQPHLDFLAALLERPLPPGERALLATQYRLLLDATVNRGL